MTELLIDRLIPYILARRTFLRLNKFLLTIALRGMGVGNWRDDRSERFFLKRLARSLPQDAAVLDVGANEGDYAKLAGPWIPSARLLVFEPHGGNSSTFLVCGIFLLRNANARFC